MVAAGRKPPGQAGPDILEARDGKTTIRLIQEAGGQRRKTRTSGSSGGGRAGGESRPVLIVGFPGPGLVGSICANYIIDRLQMHQVASVDSEFVVPTVVYIGGRLRHPFRIYSNGKSLLYALVCEAPMMPQGIHSIMDAVVKWAQQNMIGRVIVLDGIPLKSFPEAGRQVMVLTDRHHCGNGRGPDGGTMAAESYEKEEGMAGHAVGEDKGEVEGQERGGGAGWDQSRTAIMTGLAAGLLSACLSNDLDCMAALVPASSGVPDPEGAAILLEEVSKMPDVPLEVDVQLLRKQGREIRRQLGEVIERVRNEQQEQAQEQGQGAPRPGGRFGIYG